MKKFAAAVTAFLALLIALPLLTAAFVVSSAAAAVEATRCTATTAGLPATGEWRPPFQQACTVGSRSYG